MTRCLDYLDDQLGSCTISYRYNISMTASVLAVSDGSCVDLASLDRHSLQHIVDLVHAEWEGMPEAESGTDDIRQVLANGYSLSCIMIVKVKALDGRAGTLLVADLCSGGSIDRSMAGLRSLLFSLDPQSDAVECSSQESFLTCLLAPFIGGDAMTAFVTLVDSEAALSSPRAAMSALQLAELVRRIKNRATEHHESATLRELHELVVFNAQLDSERRTAHHELARLTKAMGRLNADRAKLQAACESAACGGELQRAEFEYEQARMAMEHVELQDQLRRCEIEVLILDQQNASLIYGLAHSEAMAAQLEMSLRSVKTEAGQAEARFAQEVQMLKEQLSQARDSLVASQAKASELSREAIEGNALVKRLQADLTSAEASRARLSKELEAMQVSQSQSTQQTGQLSRDFARQEAIIRELQAQLARAVADEERYVRMTSIVDARAQSSQVAIGELERQLADMRSQNAVLQARLLDVASTTAAGSARQERVTAVGASPEMRGLIARLEQEWRMERQAMNSKLDELKQSIASKELDALKATVNALQKKTAAKEPIIGGAYAAVVPERQSSKRLPTIVEEEPSLSEPEIVAVNPVAKRGGKRKDAHGSTDAKPASRKPVPVEPVRPATQAPPKPVEARKERKPSQFRSQAKPVAVSDVVPGTVLQKDVSVVASHVAKLAVTSPIKRIPKAEPPKAQLGEAEKKRPAASTVERSAFVPAITKRTLENEPPRANALGVGGMSFDAVARKKVKLPIRGATGGSNPASAEPIQTRTRANISDLTGDAGSVPSDIMAAFNVKLPPRSKK